MVTETSSLMIILVGALGSGGVVGYLSRILQKYEDRKDTIFLKTLPSLYYHLKYFDTITKAFSNSSNDGKEYVNKMNNLKTKVDEILSSGAILPTKKNEYKSCKILKSKLNKKLTVQLSDLLQIAGDLEELTSFLTTNSNNKPAIDNLRTTINEGVAQKLGGNYKTNDLFEILNRVQSVNTSIENSLDGYKSFSWKILIMIGVLAAILAALNIVEKLH